MDGFQKFDLQSDEEKNNVAIEKEKESFGDMRKKSLLKGLLKRKKTFAIIGGVIGVLVLFIIFGIIIPAISVTKSAKATYAQSKIVLDAVKKQNVEVASAELDKTKVSLLQTQKDLQKMGYLAFVPIANFYYSDADHLVKAGVYGLDGGRVLIDSVAPYADVLGLKGKGSFVGGSAQQRIQTAVTTLSKITPNIDKISVSLEAVKKELDMVNSNHYPPFFGGQKIRNQLAQTRTIVDNAATFVHEATPLIKVLPEQLGEPKEKKYLVIFQNDKELRPTGGFITAYSIMRLEHGIIRPELSDDIYPLDNSIRNKPKAPRPIALYLPKVPEFNLRDSNLSPDFVESMKTFYDMYQKSAGYKKVDGIISIDTSPLLHTIDILGGEIEVNGVRFTTKTDPRCDCPQVIYQLEIAADKPAGFVKENRKGLIGDLMIAIMNKAFSSSPKLYWGPLFQAMITDTTEKHILFSLFNQDAQSGIEALNAAGRIVAFDGDYLHINEANFGGAKSNLFIKETVSQNYDIKSDGSIEKTIVVNYKNPNPPSDCNLEHGNLCLNAVLRDWVRVYVPKGSELLDSKGSEVKLTSYEESEKTVFEGFLTVRPLGSTTFTLKYTLPFKLAKDSKLPALYQKQPGTYDNQYTVSVKGKQKEQFPLLQDKKIILTP